MNELQRRIKAVERAIKARSGGMFTVYYKDGSTRRIHPGDAIQLSLYEAYKIQLFEEDPEGGDNGIIEALVNDLLPGEETLN